MATLRNLLVPLDGSSLAEAILAYALVLAAGLSARVTLFHVMERAAPETVHGERHLHSPEEAETYLAAAAAQFAAAGIACETHLHRTPAADVAGEILDHAEELSADLILLATHGRGGLRGLLFGSIAQQIVHRGAVPVFLVTPKTGVADDWRLRRLLVPLNAQPHAESALPVAVELAQAFSAELRLIAVVPTQETLTGEDAATGALVPTAMAGVLDLEARTAADYLAETLGRLWGAGYEVSAEVRRGSPAAAVARAAADWGADLVAMATHGRSGLDALLSASVGARLVSLVDRPLLLVPLRAR